MTLSLPAAGVIAVFDPLDAIGRIALEGGEEVRFGGSACVGFAPQPGLRVFVIAAAPHPLGGWKATIVNTSGAPDEDRITTANKKAEQDERERLAWLAAETAKTKARSAFPTPRMAAAADARVLGILDALHELKRQRLLTPRAARRLPVGDDRAFVDFEWSLDVFTDSPLDPFFFAFGGADGDHLGVYLFPPALDRGEPAPVVHYFHEHARIYTPLAPSIESFTALLRTKTRADEPIAPVLGPAMRSALDLETDGDDLHTSIRELYASADPATALGHLATTIDARGWSFQSTVCRFRCAGL